MRINFRQGIIAYPTSGNLQTFLTYSGQYASLRADIGRVDVAFAHGTDDYLLTETTQVSNAWGPLPSGVSCWLYWDIDKRTAARTFGFTTIEPVYGQAQPPAVIDQHWFDTVSNTMYVYQGGAYREVIRVFAARFYNNVFYPLGYGFAPTPFAGTQVGLSLSGASVGRILVDDVGSPVRRPNGHFLTTESTFFTDGSPVNALRLESVMLTGTAQYENLHAYQVVIFSQFGEISHATYNALQTGAIALLLEDTNRYNVGAVCLQGHITNPAWNWMTVGAPLWIDDTGALVDYDLHEVAPINYPEKKPPIARVVTPTSIFFEQGLGATGPRGPQGDPARAATNTYAGSARLSLPAVTESDPVVVGDNDPRMTDARTPLAHTHTATAVTVSPYGSLNGANVQLTLNQIEDGKLAKAGGTMTGALTLSGDPTLALQAATKQYVDAAVAITPGTPYQTLTTSATNTIAWNNRNELVTLNN